MLLKGEAPAMAKGQELDATGMPPAPCSPRAGTSCAEIREITNEGETSEKPKKQWMKQDRGNNKVNPSL